MQAKVKDVIEMMEYYFPVSLAESWAGGYQPGYG